MLFKKNPKLVAAVDLGSNSFHMIVARVQDKQLHTIDTLKEMVRLASGITKHHDIDPVTAERALDCLKRFGQRLSNMHPDHVRVVGTNALRRAKRASAFIAEAEQVLGYPIEIISGIEEARLIYRGVSHCTGIAQDQTLVVDIGGGSTEVIIGQAEIPQRLESLYMGCVSMSLRFFDNGKVTQKRMHNAILAARQELEPIEKPLRQLGWTTAKGSSGTIRSIAENIQALGWDEAGITRKSLHKLRDKLLEAGHIDKIDLPDLSIGRRPVFAGGLAILIAVFEALRIQTMQTSHCALREGVLYELIGASGHNDTHTQTVLALSRRHGIDQAHATRVAQTSQQLLEQVKDNWGLDDPQQAALLDWASQLHELGLAISHSRYQQHGAYLVEHSDLPGFTRQQQTMLAVLIRTHRRKLQWQFYAAFSRQQQTQLLRLSILLRIAVVLHRSRDEQAAPPIQAQAKAHRLDLHFPADWLQQHPLTAADLAQEANYLTVVNYRLCNH